MDVLVTHPSHTSKESEGEETKVGRKGLLYLVVQALRDAKLVTDTLSQGITKFMVNLLEYFSEDIKMLVKMS